MKNQSLSSGTKNRGRTAHTNPNAFNPTKPELGQSRRNQASRPGPAKKAGHKSRGDRRDTGPTSY